VEVWVRSEDKKLEGKTGVDEMGRDSPIPLDEKEYCARTRFEPRELVLENFGVLSVEGHGAGYLIGIVTVCGMVGRQVASRVVVHCAGASSLGKEGLGRELVE
jgi:hypothetical protein